MILPLTISDKTPTYIIDAAEKGYSFECPCGELHRTYSSAKHCRKCRQYLIDPPAVVEVVYHMAPHTPTAGGAQ